MKVCVIIPTFNESKTVPALVKKILAQNLSVVIVDDGSTDNTARIAQNSGARVIRNEKNLGKGASLIRGFKYALENNFEEVITMDGDGQHLPEDIPFFLRLAKFSDGDIFIGNRMSKTQKMPFIRILTNKFMSWIISCISGQEIPDTQCGFRLIKIGVLKRVALKTSKYETESEILIKAARMGFKVTSVPIKSIYSGQKSQINPLVDTIRFIKLILNEIWNTKL
ncbi:MAG: glycosyltransferase family 2 protein [Candidatus Omnitrophica bacterium]|nr:glycosyltransferase family 2 protein [Candidatus Omnitrophota bacterium]